MPHDFPLVSVIMPVYNSAASLAVAVASVLNQSISNIEIIIVDDASTDRTSKLVAELVAQDKRIRYFRLPCNSGPSAARNVGLEAARGVWVAPIDADDEISNDRLRVLSEAGEAQSADMIADGVFFIGNCNLGSPFELSATNAKGSMAATLSIEALIRSDIPLNGSCSLGYLKPLMRRAFLQRFGLQYDEALWFAEDLNLYARALLCGSRFVLYPESHYYYNQTPMSVSRRQDTLPELADFALLCNQKLRDDDDASRRWPGLEPLLNAHRLRWSTVLWINQFKDALRANELKNAWTLLFGCPGGSRNMVSFLKDRMRGGSVHAIPNPATLTTIGRSIGYP